MQKADKIYSIHVVIGLVLMFGVGFLPPFSVVTPVGMQLIGIFLGLIYMWSTCGILWPSLLGLIAVALSDYTDINGVIAAAFGNPTIIVLIFILALLGAIDTFQVNQYLSQWFLSRRVIEGRPWVFTLMWFGATYVLGMFGNSIFSIFLMWGIFYKLADLIGLKKEDAYTIQLLVGTVLTGAISSVVFPFKDMGLFLISTYQKMSPGFNVSTTGFIIVSIVVGWGSILLYTATMRFIFRTDVSKLRQVSPQMFQDDALPPMNKLQKFLLVYMFVFIGALCLPSFLPAGWALTGKLNELGMCGIALVFFVFLCILRIDGKSLVNFSDLAGSKITWDLIFLMAAATCVSGAMVGEGTGVREFLSASLGPIFANASPFVFAALLCGVTLLLTNVANNGVVAILAFTVVLIFSTKYEINAAAMVTLLCFTCNMAFLLPASSVFGAILHGNIEWLSPKDIYRYAACIVVICLVVIIVLGIPLANRLC